MRRKLLVLAGILILIGWLTPGGLAWVEAGRNFHADFESGPPSSDHWQFDTKGDCRIESSTTRKRQGNASAYFETGNEGRCELIPRFFPRLVDKFLREPRGHDRWYSFSTYIEEVPIHTGEGGINTVIAQWHSSEDPYFADERGRGPPLALRIKDGQWKITDGFDTNLISIDKRIGKEILWYGPVNQGEWVDWIFRIKWSHREDGLTEVWKNGELLARREGPNTYKDLRGVYLKLGIYHPPSNTKMYLDEVSVVSTPPG